MATTEVILSHVLDAAGFRRCMRELTPLRLHHLREEQPPFFHAVVRRGCAAVVVLCVTEFGFRHVSYGDIGFPIHSACAAGNADVLRLLLTYEDHEVHFRASTSSSGRTLLHIATDPMTGCSPLPGENVGNTPSTQSRNQCFEAVLGKWLTDPRCCVDVIDAEGCTALHLAARSSNHDRAAALVGAGANRSVLSRGLMPPWVGAMETGDQNMLRIAFVRPTSGQTLSMSPLQSAVLSKTLDDATTLEFVRFLVETGESALEKTPNGTTLAHIASSRGKPRTAAWCASLLGPMATLAPAPPLPDFVRVRGDRL